MARLCETFTSARRWNGIVYRGTCSKAGRSLFASSVPSKQTQSFLVFCGMKSEQSFMQRRNKFRDSHKTSLRVVSIQSVQNKRNKISDVTERLWKSAQREKERERKTRELSKRKIISQRFWHSPETISTMHPVFGKFSNTADLPRNKRRNEKKRRVEQRAKR